MTQCWMVSFGRISVRPPTGRGEGVSSRTTNALKPGDRLQRSYRRSTQTCICPPVENRTYAAFEEYEEVPETVPLDFTEDNVTWVVSKLYGTADALGVEAIELQNWLLRFGCGSEELRVVIASLADWMANSFPPPGPHIAH